MSGVEESADTRQQAIDALIVSRAELIPESLSAGLLELNKAVQQYASQHRTFAHQVSETQRTLLSLLDSLIVLSLGDDIHATLLTEQLSAKEHVREIVREEIAERFKPTESQKKALEAFRKISSLGISEREPSASPEKSIASLQEQATLNTIVEVGKRIATLSDRVVSQESQQRSSMPHPGSQLDQQA